MITVAELSVGAYKSPRKDALEKTLKLLSIVNVVDLSRETAVGGRIYAELMKKGEGIELNDCLIAAPHLFRWESTRLLQETLAILTE